eukprot:366064-Chlamydomonas_euryale.AAC.15
MSPSNASSQKTTERAPAKCQQPKQTGQQPAFNAPLHTAYTPFRLERCPLKKLTSTARAAHQLQRPVTVLVVAMVDGTVETACLGA